MTQTDRLVATHGGYTVEICPPSDDQTYWLFWIWEDNDTNGRRSHIVYNVRITPYHFVELERWIHSVAGAFVLLGIRPKIIAILKDPESIDQRLVVSTCNHGSTLVAIINNLSVEIVGAIHDRTSLSAIRELQGSELAIWLERESRHTFWDPLLRAQWCVLVRNCISCQETARQQLIKRIIRLRAARAGWIG